MGRRCKHRWKVVGGAYQPPIGTAIHLKRVSPEFLAELMQGFTLLTQLPQCDWVEGSRTAGKLDLGALGFEWDGAKAVEQ